MSGGKPIEERRQRRRPRQSHPVDRVRRESRHRRVEVRRGDDHRLLGDADRGRAQRRRFGQPAAADVGPPPVEQAARRVSSVRLWPRALFLELRRRGAGVRARRRRFDLRRLHPHRRARSRRCRRSSLMACCSSPSCSKADRRSPLQGFQAAKGRLGWFAAVRRSKDPPAFIVLLENGAAMAGSSSPRSGWPVAAHRRSLLRRPGLGRHRPDPRRDRLVLAYESKALLIGEAADPDLVADLRDAGRAAAGNRRRRRRPHRPFRARPDHRDDDVDFDDDISAGDVERIGLRSRRKRWSAGRRCAASSIRPMQRAAEQFKAAKGEARSDDPVDARRFRPAQRVDPDQRQRRVEAARRGGGLGVRQRLHARRRRVGGAARPRGQARLPRPPSRPLVRRREGDRDGRRPDARGAGEAALRHARRQRHGARASMSG